MDAESFSYASRIIGYSAGGFIMWWVGRGLPKKYGLEGKDLRQELLATVDEFVAAGTNLTRLPHVRGVSFSWHVP